LSISETLIEKKDYENIHNKNIDIFNDENIPEEDLVENIENFEKSNQLSAEEEREKRRKMKLYDQIKSYEKKVEKSDTDISPSLVTNTKEYINKYIREKQNKIIKISNSSKKISKKTKERIAKLVTPINYKIGKEETKEFFRKKDQYLGQCQICGFTFKTKKGINYCERFTWSDKRINIKTDLVEPGNSLCLCAKCHSIIKGGGDFEATFLTKISEKLEQESYNFDDFVKDIKSKKILQPPQCFKEHIDFDVMYYVDIRLNRKDERIYFTEEHLLMFFECLKQG